MVSNQGMLSSIIQKSLDMVKFGTIWQRPLKEIFNTIGERSDRCLSAVKNGMPIRLGGAGEASVLCS